MYKVGLISLGCVKNLVDSEMILGMLSSSDFRVVNSIEESDVIIVNTCGFIEESKQESIENILDVIKYNKKTVVVGCLVERYKDELIKAIPEVDLFVSIHEYHKLNELLMALLENSSIQKLNPFVRMLSTPHFMAYLRISEGCNNCCTYCAIPLIRGSFRSRPLNDLVSEAKELVKNGIKELVIISQDTSRYGSDIDNNTTIVTLLEQLVKIEELYSIRLLYLYPDEITEEFIDFIKNNSKVSPYFDIPLQHASNKILKKMNRRGTKEDYEHLLNKIKAKIPHAILRTTFIVGFPSESEDDFVELVSFIKNNQFDHLGAFSYSREDGTKSYNFKHQVDDKLKKARLHFLLDTQKRISYQKTKEHLGEIMEGIVTGYDDKKNVYYLRSYWNAPDDIDGTISFVANNTHQIGDIVKVKITNAFVYDLLGEEVA